MWSSAPPETQRRVVMLSRDEVIALAAATVIDKTNPVVSASNGGESVSKRIKQLRQTPLIGTRPTIRTLVNKSAIINESNGPSASHVEVTPLRNIQLIPTPRTESSTQKIESFSKSNCARNLLTTISTSNLSAFMSQSSVNDRRSYISAPSSSLNPTSNSINNIKNISATKTGITIKRQLSEAVISIRPATSRLLDNN
ncbi:hypothetical protein KSF78_0001121 [Schistosoma japonicum]|nr:hypothetical protein KSF78_0001121 [Schistosoma japonicum]